MKIGKGKNGKRREGRKRKEEIKREKNSGSGRANDKKY